MKKKIIALIVKEEVSSWKSCQSITSNLEKVYRILFERDEIILIKVPQKFNRYDAYKIASEIKSKNIEQVFWLDHKPNAAILLSALDCVYTGVAFGKRPKLNIHLFGDFVLDCLGWQMTKDALANWPIHFFVASRKQQELVESFFISDKQNVSVVPFPVDENDFYFDNTEKLRKTFRDKLGVDKDDLVLVYTGRISYQKNIEILVKTFSTAQILFQKKVHLWIAGEWDDILMPYSGKFGPLGSFYAQFNGTSEKYLNSNIKFLGKLDSKQLLESYNAADMFISLSTYNDEDYGMSPAEAMSCGLPCLLSNWGGYSSFAEYSSKVNLVPVLFGNTRAQVNHDLARKSLIKAVGELPLNSNDRNKASVKAQEKISLKGVSRLLETQLSQLKYGPVSDFTTEFLRLCVLSEMNPGSPFKNGKKLELSDFYKVVYARYGS